MVAQFQDQGGVAAMDPSPLLRWAASLVLRRMASPDRIAARRTKVERARRQAGAAHTVEYFHQVDDGYSHLAAQLLRPLLDAYDIRLVCHLAPGPSDRNAPEPELLLDLSRYDASRIAPHYGLSFPANAQAPDAALLEWARRILAGVNDSAFPDIAPLVGDALWTGSMAAMRTLAERYPPVDRATAEARVNVGAKRRAALGHYSGGMFHYGKEWYWGVDRLYHLENRLAELGARHGSGSLLAPRPAIATGPRKDDGSLTLEIYPSLRSPYTAVAFDAAVALAQETGVTMAMRPVLPMVMRGVPATRAKGFYIFTDASREARALQRTGWGRFYDPIGEPVRRCYSLYPWAVSQGRGVELLSAFLHAAFYEGVNANRESGLRHVVEAAGLPWSEADATVGNRDWENEIEANRLAMYEFGLWGVPSFRLLDATGETLLRAWGQDRLWLVSREIQRALAAPASARDSN